MPALKVIVNNERESILAERLINLLNGGKASNICKDYGVYETYPRIVFGTGDHINTYPLTHFDRLTNKYVTLDELRNLWMEHPDSGFTDLNTHHNAYDYSKLYNFRITWMVRHVIVFGTEVCNIQPSIVEIKARDVNHAVQIWKDSYASENAANLISCVNLERDLPNYLDEDVA